MGIPMNRKEKLIFRILVTKFNNNKRKPISIDQVRLETGMYTDEIHAVLKVLASSQSIVVHSDKSISIPDDVFAIT